MNKHVARVILGLLVVAFIWCMISYAFNTGFVVFQAIGAVCLITLSAYAIFCIIMGFVNLVLWLIKKAQ